MARSGVKFDSSQSPLDVMLRDTWEAKPPTSTEYIEGPISTLFCGLRTPSKACQQPGHCQMLIREMQDRDMNAGLPDIRYNFLIGGDNKVYEGRGWAVTPSLPTRYDKLKSTSLYIAFMGPLTPGGIRPNHNMIFQRNLLVELGLQLKIIKRKFLLVLLYKI